MKITICAVGRLKKGPERELIDRYTARITLPFEIREVEERKPLPGPALQESEAALLEKACPGGASVVVLDERGAALDSEAFAAMFDRQAAQGRDIAFLIGGAGGIARRLRDSADRVLSLGAPTWPHMLARVMLIEQIYRAQQILAGHPYHRGKG